MVLETSPGNLHIHPQHRLYPDAFDVESTPLLNNDTDIPNGHMCIDEDVSKTPMQSTTAYSNSHTESTPPPPQKPNTSTGAKTTWRVVFAACVAASGASFQFGYHVGDYGAAAIDISTLGNMSGPTNSWSLIQYMAELTSFLLGGLIGAIVGGAFANRIGRKKTLLLNDLTFIIGALLMAFSRFFLMWVVGRFLIGFGSGVGTIGMTPF
ncbi:hypothetical protein SARC_03058 [Sphaeroforma arctica JP610]|uniref:Major facilitator superfamily (MFS) profile domain-containing protein n=1 Tax=Sphaeroforma arctica JP610 TaxID=667725 RepID=A0A0L0G6R8_9EUKA|nr:hypothetical protein SARC_03058 [Sphaeroforma arctica JP610]KNC84717.1 hypothetical protein SARC_03058 [Sphaeroforma arctica JP610]|eukprot:XP_014158619.1 hypothetical protein SARC_03058 [Sphaeroforma arctica JP610]